METKIVLMDPMKQLNFAEKIIVPKIDILDATLLENVYQSSGSVMVM